jgi:adenine/guanine phosphoribosyltransferase-like PRPP-binding protein
MTSRASTDAGFRGTVAEEVRARVRLVPGNEGLKRHLVHPLNGRGGPVDHDLLEALGRALLAGIDRSAVDCVLGFPEGGSIPAYALGRLIDRPVVLSSRLPFDVADRITFEQPKAGLGTTHYVYGLPPGQRVLIVEDELTNGQMAVNAVRALRAAGLVVEEIATLLAIDHPALWRRMRDERITLHVGAILPPEYAPRSLDDLE